jgi:hypothetical protein
MEAGNTRTLMIAQKQSGDFEMNTVRCFRYECKKHSCHEFGFFSSAPWCHEDVCKFEPIIDAYSKERVEKQRKVLEQALHALQLCATIVSNEQIYRRDKAITAIQEVLK